MHPMRPRTHRGKAGPVPTTLEVSFDMFASDTVRIAAVALVLTLAAAGCGSVSSHSSSDSRPADGSSSATQTQQAPPSTADTSPSTSGATVDGVYTTGEIGVTKYLSQIQPVRRQLVIVRSSTSAMVTALHSGDAVTAGNHALAAASDLRRALTIARRIHPGEPLATIHKNLLANLRLGITYLTRMGNDLSAVDLDAIHQWRKTVMPKVHFSEQLYREWAANLAAFCTVDGVKPPAWLKTMDRWN
jgi:hypothetical protein